MTILVSDDFNRTNANPIGGNWVTAGSQLAMQIVSNAITPSSLTPNDDAAYYNLQLPNDQWAECNVTVTGTSATAGPGLMLRCATGGTSSFYRVVFNHGTTTNVALGKFVSGTFTSLWTRLSAFTDGARMRFEARGTTLRVFINGVQVGADTTDSALTTGRAGVAYSSAVTSCSQDNFTAGDFVQTTVIQNAALYRAHNW